MSYEKELAAAKKAASLAACLCQKVQKALLQSDVHSKSDKSPVTVADYEEKSTPKTTGPPLIIKDLDLPKSVTSKKLNGLNYMAWAHAVRVYLRGQRMLKYLIDDPPNSSDPTYEDWMCADSAVMGLLWHSMEPYISTTVEFCDSSKKIWESIADSFSQQSNVSQVYELYEQIFTTKQSGKPLAEYYSTLKNLWDQLLQHRPFTVDLEQQKRHWEEFMISCLLFGLDSDLRGFKDQILASETLPTAANAYSRLLRSSLGQHSSMRGSTDPLETNALVSNSGSRGGFRGGFRGGRNFRGNSRGGGRSSGRGDRKCDYCGGTNHTEPYCFQKYGKPNYVNQVIDGPVQPQLQPQSQPTSLGSAATSSSSHDALGTQLAELLVQHLRITLPLSQASSSTATLANSGSQDQEDDWFGA